MRSVSLLALMAASLALSGCAGGSEQEVANATAGMGAASAASLDPTSLEYFKVAVGDRVYFNTDQSDLTPEARAVLDRQAEWLRLNPETRVTIEGHADERGTREYNLALGARRANAVTSYLAGRGVAPDRMNAVTYGRERPVETCSADSCWARNRRAVTAPQ